MHLCKNQGRGRHAHRTEGGHNGGDVQRPRHALHEHVADVGQDDARGQQHQQREHEGADRVGQLEPRILLRTPSTWFCLGLKVSEASMALALSLTFRGACN